MVPDESLISKIHNRIRCIKNTLFYRYAIIHLKFSLCRVVSLYYIYHFLRMFLLFIVTVLFHLGLFILRHCLELNYLFHNYRNRMCLLAYLYSQCSQFLIFVTKLEHLMFHPFKLVNFLNSDCKKINNCK